MSNFGVGVIAGVIAGWFMWYAIYISSPSAFQWLKARHVKSQESAVVRLEKERKAAEEAIKKA